VFLSFSVSVSISPSKPNKAEILSSTPPPLEKIRIFFKQNNQASRIPETHTFFAFLYRFFAVTCNENTILMLSAVTVTEVQRGCLIMISIGSNVV
jgi:hypothetical protein